MDIHRLLNLIIKPFRIRRMNYFLKLINPNAEDRILDVGGNAYNWSLIECKNSITLLNLGIPQKERKTAAENFQYVIGDGTDLNYSDREYDICFSNSVVEHVGDFQKQKMFAREIRRVGKKLWVQTPARTFFFEPHYVTPFVHWLPESAQKKVLRYFSIWGLIARPSQKYIDDFVDQTRLLTYSEFCQLFPDCVIIRERFLFMTKSYIAVRTALSPNGPAP